MTCVAAFAALCVLSLVGEAQAQTPCADGRVLVSGAYCCWPGQSATMEGVCVGPPACPSGTSASGADCVAAPPPSACVEGRVAVSGGYCCWPGQTVNDAGRCSGPPRCPSGLVASGSDCTASVVSARSSTGVSRDGSFASTAAPPPPAGNQVRGGLLGGGITLILVGYLGSAITGTIGGAQTAYTGGYYGSSLPALPAWPFAWVPFLHPFMALNSNGGWGTVAGIVGAISSGMEIAGLIMAIVGQIGAPAEPSTGDFTLRFGAPDSDGGLSGVLTF